MTTISVIIPTYNLENLIERTIACVLGQTSLPDEIVVVDDGSSDGTVACAQRVLASAAVPVRIIAGDHRGPGATRNRAFAAATGNWIAFLDGDDEWDPRKIERVRETIAAHPEATMIAHDEFERDLAGRTVHKPLHERFDANEHLLVLLYRSNFLSTSCVAVRRELIVAVGGMDENLPSSQDYDLWLKLARTARLVFIPEALETYVLRENSITSRTFTRFRCMVTIAWRHAPHVARVAGAARAWLLRLRLIAANCKAALSASLAQRDVGVMTRVMLRSPFDVGRALLTPVPRSGR